MKTETIFVLVKEPGKGRKAMPPVTAVALLTGYKEDFEANNPIRYCIDTKGNALPVRDEPYLCREVWQCYSKKEDWHNTAAQPNNSELTFEQFAKYMLPFECRIAYQLIEDEVKGEKGIDWTEDLAHENGNYKCKCGLCGRYFQGHKRRVRCKECASTPVNKEKPKHCGVSCVCVLPEDCSYNSTPVNEAKETYSELKDRLSKIVSPLEREATEFATLNFDTTENEFKAAYEGVLHGANYRATYPIENKEWVNVDELITKHACREYRHEANEAAFDCDMVEFQKYDLLLLLKEYNAQFTPIEQGKRMVDVEKVIGLIHYQMTKASPEVLSALDNLISSINNLNKE